MYIFTFLDMKVEPSSPIRNTNPFSRSSSGSSLHAGNHSSSSGHGMYLNNKSTLSASCKIKPIYFYVFIKFLNLNSIKYQTFVIKLCILLY